MDNSSFKRLTANIRRKWDRVRGLLVKLDNGSGGKVTRLTAGPANNPGLVLENVKLWDGETLRRECQPGDKELQKELTSCRICRAYVTYVDECSRGSRPIRTRWICLGKPDKCGVEWCPARGRENAE